MIEYTLEEAEKVWLISDTHFDHTNIIRYCNRPFKTTGEMNNIILRNWHKAIRPGDIVYFLGDMAFGRGSRWPQWWVTQLSGKIIWVKGSHDRGIRTTSILPNVEKVVPAEQISCNGVEFMLVHDMFNARVNGWHGWLVHGHCHNTRPFIDGKKINVSVEAIGYKPISLYEILQAIKGG